MRFFKLILMEFVSKGIPIITIPIIISLLSNEAYALFGLYQTLTMVFFYFIGLGSNASVSNAFGRNNFDLDFATGNLIVSLFLTSCFFLLFYLALGLSSIYFFSFFGAFFILVISVHRDISYIGGKDSYVLLTNPFFILVSQLFLLFFLFFFTSYGFKGKFYADLITVLLLLGLLYYFGFYQVFKFKKPRFSFIHLFNSMKATLPLTLRQCYPWLKSAIEREIFIGLYPIKVLSDYTLAFQISTALILIVNIYLSSRLSYIYSLINNHNYLEVRKVFFKIFLLFVSPPICLAVLVWILFSFCNQFYFVSFIKQLVSIDLIYSLSVTYLVYSIIYASQSLMVYFFNVNKVLLPVIVQYLTWLPMFLIFVFDFYLSFESFVIFSLILEVFCAFCYLFYFNWSISGKLNVKG